MENREVNMEIKGNINGIEFGSVDRALEILSELCGIKQAPETEKSSEDIEKYIIPELCLDNLTGDVMTDSHRIDRMVEKLAVRLEWLIDSIENGTLRDRDVLENICARCTDKIIQYNTELASLQADRSLTQSKIDTLEQMGGYLSAISDILYDYLQL